mmetsp:Transcript_26588/g.73117  ORF Transcript_26588/g.73117 Transcript_26588/m.73117 type:complete len:324 (+) Transcript_26588:2768-3739(+)
MYVCMSVFPCRLPNRTRFTQELTTIFSIKNHTRKAFRVVCVTLPITLDAAGVKFSPLLSHFRGQLGVVGLEFLRCVGKHDDDGVDSAGNGRQKHEAYEETGDESDAKCGAAVISCQTGKVRVSGGVRHTHRAHDQSKHHGKKRNCATHQVIGNDGFPTAVLEQLHDCLSCLDVAESVDADVDVRPLVEVLHNALDAAEDALGNAGKDPRVIVVSSRVGDGSECLNDGHQERSKANGSETGRDGSNEGVADCLGAAPGLVRCHPPGCNGSGHGDVHAALQDLLRKIQREEEQEEVSVVDIARVPLAHHRYVIDSHEGDRPDDDP